MTPRRAKCVVCDEAPRKISILCQACIDSAFNGNGKMQIEWAARRARAFERKRQKKPIKEQQ